MPYPLPPYRVGIAGAGAFAEFLAGALAPLPEFQLTAVAGRTDEKRQRVLDAYRHHRSDAAPRANIGKRPNLSTIRTSTW